MILALVFLFVTAGDRLEIAKQLVKAGQFASATSELTAIVESSPSAIAYNLLGYCYVQQHVTSSAEENFKKAIALDPAFKPAHHNLAGLYLLAGKPREAISELSALIRLDPSDARAYYDLGHAELSAGDIQSARNHLQKAHDLLPSDVNNAIALARAHQENSDYPAALKTLTEIGEQNTPEWHAVFGYSSFRTNRPEVAITELQKAIDLDSRNQDYLLQLSEVLLTNYNAPAAIALLEPATSAFPDSPRLWFALGISRMLNDDPKGAESALQSSLRLDPKLDLAYIVLGRGYLNAGEWTQLLATARTLISVNPQNADGYYYRAMALLRTQGEEPEIESLLRKSVALDPAGSDSRYELGKLLLHKGNKQAALAEFEAVIRTDPDHGQAYYQLSRLYQAGGETAKAQQAEKDYEPYLDTLASRDDLNYIFQEMLGEITSSHLRGGGGSVPRGKRVAGGLLGADFQIANGRYRLKRIYTGESWNPQLRAPLSGPGIDVKEGEYLLEINGHPLSASDDVFAYLEGTAGKRVSLRVGPDPSGANSRDVTVVPAASEQALRNLAWIESNRRKVDELSGGKLAYVYMPDTAGAGLVSFNRYFFAQVDKQGVVLDERFNGGGQVADYVIEVLNRPLLSWNVFRYGEMQRSPAGSIQGPKVMIINEPAGSGGDMMPWMFRYTKAGTLVGKRTWGGLIGVLEFPTLMDGGTITAPNVRIASPNGAWIAENTGVAPDVEVELDPKAVHEGHDPQLERAVAIAMDELKRHPPAAPIKPVYPDYQKGK